MALDQFVTAVQTLSAQGNYAELCDHLNKSQEVPHSSHPHGQTLVSSSRPNP
jgi:hypothetical protein